MHHRKTYMYNNFQQNRISRSVKTVHTNLFAKNCKLYKFAITNCNFEKINSFIDMHHYETYMYIDFQQSRVNRSVITVLTNVVAKKIAFCINLQLPIIIFKKLTLLDMHHRKMYIVYQFSAKSG